MALSNKEQKVFQILRKDETQRNYFFRKVKDIKWFQPLFKEGFFDINQYPIIDTSKVKQGENIAWIQLLYIEVLITQLKDSPNHSYFDPIKEIIGSIINSSYNNYWIDNRINKILSLLPQDKVEIDLLRKHFNNIEAKATNRQINDHIVITELFPAILNSGDDKKIELLINEIFEFKAYENSIVGTNFKTKFVSSSLERSMTNEFLSEYDVEILKLIYSQLIGIIIPQMRILKDRTEIKFKIGEDKYSLKIEYTDIFSFKVFVSGKESFDFKIENYNLKTREKVFQEIRYNFSQIDLSKLVLNDFVGDSKNDITAPFERLYIESYNISSYKIFDNEKHYGGNDITTILQIVIRLIEIIYEKEVQGSSEFVEKLISDYYFFPFFKCASLSLICNNYDKLRTIFWDNIDKYNLLSDYNYDDDAFYLLDNNKDILSDEEISKFVKIIEVGPVIDNKENYDHYKTYWQFKWYSLLKHIDKYNLKYEELKLHEVNKGKDFIWRPTGIMTFYGPRSPIDFKELEQKSVSDTVNYLLEFKNDKSDFTAPDEEGLSSVLKEVIENNPVKYIKELELFMPVHNTYVYTLTDALENKFSKDYNAYISKILNFYYKYISADNFTYEKQQNEDYFRLKPGEYTIRVLFRLLKKIVADNSVKIEKSDLTKINKLIELIHPLLKPEYYKDASNGDSYIVFTINNPQGMFYGLLLEMSLREGRDFEFKNEKWQYKHYFDNAIAENNDSALTVFGQYYKNFLWLNKEWALAKFKSIEIGSEPWQAFFGGHLPVNPIIGTGEYESIKPSYEYLIKNNINYSISGGYGIGDHLFRLYYNETIDLEVNGLIDLYYSTQNKSKTELVGAILRCEKFLIALEGKKKSTFEKKLTNLITFITGKLTHSKEDKDIETLYSLFNLIILFKKLNGEVVSALLSITKNMPIGNYYHRFIYDLVDYIKIDNSTEYANMLLQIYENLYEDLINVSIYSYTIDIWDFIMDKADFNSHKENILRISETFIRRGEDRLQEYFTKLADQIKTMN